MVLNRKKNEIFKVSEKEAIDLISLPSCYANYWKSHISCKCCAVKMKCKSIQRPKEPHWCNPD